MERIAESIWKISHNSNIYVLDFKEKIVIDAGDRNFHDRVRQDLIRIIDPAAVQKVIFTHLHYDHIGNFDLFCNARFYASADAIEDFKNDPVASVLNLNIVDSFSVRLTPLDRLDGFDIISTPGHTRGSICLYYRKDRILFSGDTLFFGDHPGRIDLPTSAGYDAMQQSLERLKELPFAMLCPGHDY